MKIRTQLLLACFLLSVLPLTGLVVYSYHSSRRALQSAYHREATRLTAQMDRRLTTIRSDLDQRLAGLSAIPLGGLHPGTTPTPATRTGIVDNILMAMGDAAPLVDALEFVPTPPAPAAPVVKPSEPSPVPEISSGTEDAVSEAKKEGEAEKARDEAISEPIVIDLPPVKYPKFAMPADFSRRIAEITNLSIALGRQTLTKEEREALETQLRQKQDQLNKDMAASREVFHQQMQQANEQRRERETLLEQRREALREERTQQRDARVQHAEHAAPPAPPPASASAPAAPEPATTPKPVTRIVTVRSLSLEQKQLLRTKEKQASLLFGQRFNVPLHSEGKVVGQIRAQLSTPEVIKRVLGSSNEDSAEIPFAVDRENNVYTRDDADRRTLANLGIIDAFRNQKPLPHTPNWVIAMGQHKESGLRIGVARPVGENLEELRNAAARNFGLGIGVIALALIGILPVADHFTRDVELVTEGAERIAQGDLLTRLPVKSNNEFGQLASAFNRMAEDLSLQQQKLVEQERARRDADIQQRLLAIEYERKSVELEDARRFQLSMLPKHVPQHERYDIASLTQTATEVGGDYYDFHLSDDGALSVTTGDATGHGAKAGTMVTVVKTLFSGYDSSIEPSAFLSEAAEKIKRMDLGRMAMALSLARFDRQNVTIASAGMPPVLIHRIAENKVDEISLGATPLGTLGVDYKQTRVDVTTGDTILLMSDGFPELQNADGQQLGYQRAMQEFASAATAENADGVIAHLRDAAMRWHGDQPPNDDVTFVVVRCRA